MRLWILISALLTMGLLSGCGPEDQANANAAMQDQKSDAAVQTPPMPPAN